jgi:hypothetical protein
VRIDVRKQTYDRLAPLMRAMGRDADGVVTALLDSYQDGGAAQPARRPPKGPGGGPEAVAVFAVYEGTLTDGRYYPASGAVEIVGGPLDGKRFKSPSGAAIAVVRSVNRKVHPNRNGWAFWGITETGERLQSIRPQS